MNSNFLLYFKEMDRYLSVGFSGFWYMEGILALVGLVLRPHLARFTDYFEYILLCQRSLYNLSCNNSLSVRL